ncbi:MAG: type IX secretion system membrane protein PorP/SprF [Sediminibacterium sp. Gen4]|jgi:hypothetical protein|uniref:type IX secretion system membrane protein PorP/SprF n=1 Tax=unclassified Sediminibacterium TaxID=2635961 RepID=UPI0015BB6EA0|nr:MULTISPECIES: type IX secretion system membrane protein PorP/SprF [unclassified Sediminibacterium]MBW0162728.1 type IX secretion system membrane protein PorP/SprF [Sediminibacterium sp.]MBW0164836.1 type IX secretion system membrane protein PorP/SprF [Sediminibacterium sp.]NWK65643.1 type IX secretion system membrane protein PorP/SprF [Sediminibacterium sp. Gen4]
MKKTVLSIFFSILISVSFSQSFLSQYEFNNILINPANTGNFRGHFRTGVLHRSEGAGLTGNVTNSSFFFETKLLKKLLKETDQLSIGVTGIGEKNPFDGIKNSFLLISGSFQKGLNEDGSEKIVIGFQSGFSNRRIEPPLYIFESQLNRWISSGFVGLDPTQAQTINIGYNDLNTGIVYELNNINKIRLRVGATFAHINSPYKPFNGGVFSLSMKTSFQIEIEKTYSSQNKVVISLIKNNLQNNDYSGLGLLYNIKIPYKNYLWGIGMNFRSSKTYGEAIIPKTHILFNTFSINLSYDIPLQNSSFFQQNAFEIGLSYIGLTPLMVRKTLKNTK